MADKLKECPFCGGEAEISTQIFGGIHYRIVRCSFCGVQTINCLDEKDAIEVWNNRSNWHTGTPTEEGWYLLHVRGTIPFRVAYMRNWQWLSTDDSRIRTDVVIEWQKIEGGEEVNGSDN